MIFYTPVSTSSYAAEPDSSPSQVAIEVHSNSFAAEKHRQWMFSAAIFLVSVPVFIQAPLVRAVPLLSLVATVGFLICGRQLSIHHRTHHWGDLLIGFTWTWLAGSIYWGWLRWEPFLHLPVEAIGLPFAIWSIRVGKGKIGNFFYLGSLLGTVVTDIFFYIVDLIPAWRTLMMVGEDFAQQVLQGAIAKVQSPWGISWAVILASVLLVVGLLPLRSQKLHWWAFSGAVLSTILVDGLFWLAACAA